MKQSIIFLFLLLSLISYCFGADIVVNNNSGELTCLNNLATNTGGYTLASLSTTFCSTSGNDCYQNGSISKISFTQTKDYSISSSDFSCFPYVTDIKIAKGKVLESFFTSFTPLVDNLQIESTILSTFTVTIAKVRQLVIGGTFTTINASQLKNVQSFGFLSSSQLVDIIPDSNEPNSVLSNLGVTTNKIPNISYFKNLKSFSIRFGSGFDATTYSNIQYFSQLTSISFSGSSSPIDFPYQLTEMVNPQYTSLQFWVKFNTPSKLIDLSNNQGDKDVYVSFQTPGSDFTIDGNFPISKLPKRCDHFEMSGSLNMNMPDFNIFKDTQYIFFSQGTIRNNLTSATPFTSANSFGMNSLGLKGTVDETWCNSLPSFYNNKLEGRLPDCFYCHLSGTSYVSSLFDLNLFSNFNKTSSDCDYSQINVELDLSNPEHLTIYGKNIGYDSRNIITEPQGAISSIIQFENGNFTTYLTSSAKNITIKFKSQPKLSFTVSTSRTAPVIDSIVQVNTTITIQGSYFNNIPQNLKVGIEGGLDCTVTSSSFYNITCSIDQYYPIKPWGNKLLTINTVAGLSSSKSFNLLYTPIPCPVDDCNGNGECNDHEGICECDQKWLTIGDDICTIANIYVSSSSQVDSSTGGTIKLYGWYGPNNDNYYVSIGGNDEIQGEYLSDDELEVDVAPGTGKVSIKLRMGSVEWEGYIYPYIEKLAVIQCFNNCTSPSNGVCNTTSSECKCKPNFYGLDCSSISPSSPISTLNTNSGLPISLTNEQTGFYIDVVSITEYALNGTMVNNLNPTWKYHSNSYYIAKSDTSNTDIASISFTNYKNQSVSFTNNQFFIQDGIVASFNLLNWNYKNASNVLQVVVSSVIKIDNKATQNNCNSAITQLSSGSMVNSSSNINFLKVSQNAKTFYARIYDKADINNNPTQIETKLISNENDKVLLGFNLPHTTTISLYSDFQLFLSPDFKPSTSCESSESNEPSSSSIVVYSGYLLVSLILFILI